MQAFPNRFPNEIEESLDIGLYSRILQAANLYETDQKRRLWLDGSLPELTPDEWATVKEMDELAGVPTMRIEGLDGEC